MPFDSLAPFSARTRAFVFAGLTAALVLGLAVPAAFAQDAPIKIAVVDLDVVVANSPAGKELGQKLETFQQQIQTEAQGMQTAVQELRQRIADGANSLSDERLAELQKEYEDSMIAIRRFRDDKQREGQKMQDEGLREIEKQLEPIFAKVRDENGYDLILNRVPGVVILAGERVDITAKMIETLGAQAGGN